jgi:hypothetical protein
MRKARSPSSHPQFEDWPPQHRRAWEAAFEAVGLFATPTAAMRWRAASARKTRLGYGAWLHWRLSQRDLDAAMIELSRPEDLVSPAAVLAYVEHLASLHSSDDRLQSDSGAP